MIYSRLEAEVQRMIEASGAKILKQPSDPPQAFDFGIEFDGKKVAVEVKAEATPSTFYGVLGYQGIRAAAAGYNEIWLVSPAGPPLEIQLYVPSDCTAEWLSIDGLARKLKQPVANQQSLDSQPVALLDVLSAQFGHEALRGITSDDDLDRLLKLGKRQEDVTAVFADIKSFTEIVHNFEPSTLNEMLARYYDTARALASKYAGTFDKVIGDAVLAVFNYPPIPNAAASALRYAIEVVKTGRAILEEFAERSTAVVETGIRIGVATGEVWPINVGQKIPQVSFVGDPLNLAARLQHQAAVNGIVTCRATWLLVERQDPSLAVGLKAESFQIPYGTLAGIATAINAQRIAPESIGSCTDA
jgi:class 3 adenylate cyclase